MARDANTSSSYKPALLKAIVRIVRAGGGPNISLLRIASEFAELYWTQTVVFRLRQGSTVVKEPEVVQLIRNASSSSIVRRLNELPGETRHQLDRKISRVLTIDVLNRFHNSGPQSMPRIFGWEPGQEFLELSTQSMVFVRSNGQALETIANHWWARKLERFNLLAPLIIEKVENNGARRTSLTKYLDVLRLTDGSTCFYCDRQLEAMAITHIDHFIPWSFLLSDPFWDLVLACRPCNLNKSDTIPAEHYVNKLIGRAMMRSKATLPKGFGSPLLLRDELDRYFAAAVSVDWPTGWEPIGTLD